MPKAKISKEMIIDAALEITRTDGIEKVFAKTIALRLQCSTQPVLYYFDTMEEIRKAVFDRAEQFHMAYISNVKGEYENPLLEIAIRYIRFAGEEKHMFHLLFQTDRFANRNLNNWVYDAKILPIISAITQQTGLSEYHAQNLFLSLYVTMHGYASLLANNAMEYNELSIADLLRRTIRGQIAVLGEKHESNHI